MPSEIQVLRSRNMGSGPVVSWQEIDGQRCLVITFVGKLTAGDARRAMAEVTQALHGTEGMVPMVWDAAEMTGYESAARTLWQDGLADLKPKIRAIHLVSQSAVIRMGAAVVGMFVGYPIKSWATRAAIRHDA